MNTKNDSKNGTVTIDGDGYATLRYERRLPHPPEAVWKAVTDPKELAAWFNTKATIDGRPGGRIDYVSSPSGFHTTGRILTWDPPRVFEHEWLIDPHEHLPNGEPESVIRWELVRDGTVLTVMHRRLTRGTALGFAPSWYAFLDRLGARLGGEKLPDWQERYGAVKASYPAWER